MPVLLYSILGPGAWAAWPGRRHSLLNVENGVSRGCRHLLRLCTLGILPRLYIHNVHSPGRAHRRGELAVVCYIGRYGIWDVCWSFAMRVFVAYTGLFVDNRLLSPYSKRFQISQMNYSYCTYSHGAVGNYKYRDLVARWHSTPNPRLWQTPASDAYWSTWREI